MRKILFITGTRADYGKIKSLIQGIEASKDMEAYVFVSGMHLLETYGSTYREVLKDGYKNVYVCVDTDELGDSGPCWAEIDGLVYDPLFAEAKNYYKYYGATYASYGLTSIRRVAI